MMKKKIFQISGLLIQTTVVFYASISSTLIVFIQAILQNIKRIVEFNEADAVIQKYISNNGQMDEKAEIRRNINTAQRQKSEHANRFEISEKLKRLKHREKYRLSINLKQKQLYPFH
jgi:uncharacterized membrane protein YhiD involved in acid resistance